MEEKRGRVSSSGRGGGCRACVGRAGGAGGGGDFVVSLWRRRPGRVGRREGRWRGRPGGSERGVEPGAGPAGRGEAREGGGRGLEAENERASERANGRGWGGSRPAGQDEPGGDPEEIHPAGAVHEGHGPQWGGQLRLRLHGEGPRGDLQGGGSTVRCRRVAPELGRDPPWSPTLVGVGWGYPRSGGAPPYPGGCPHTRRVP